MDYFDILLARKLANKGDITTESLSVTENGTYTAPSGKAYTPVIVSVAPPENSYQLKSITTPTSLATFNASAMPMPTLKVSVEAKQEGSGTPSPENIRPISGWSEVVVSDVGKNLANVQKTNTVPSISTGENVPFIGWTTDYIKVDTNVSYTLSVQQTVARSILFYTNDKTYLGYIGAFPLDGVVLNIYSRWSEVGYIRLRFDAETTAQLEVGTSATTYEPYNGFTTTISLGQTVYGAEVDVVNGVLKITKILYTKTRVSYYGLYGDDNAPLFYFDISDNIKGYWDITCDSNNKLDSNYYSPISTINGAGMKDCEIRTQQATPPTKIYFRDDRFTDESSINTWLASNPLQVLSVLATPIIVPLTPTLIKSLDGTNNLSVDCGDVIEGEYFKALGGDDNE